MADTPATLSDLIPLVVASVNAANSIRAYERCLTNFFEWYEDYGQGRPFGKALAQAYLAALKRRSLSASSVNQSLTVLRKLAQTAVEHGLLDTLTAVSIGEISAMPRRGSSAGQWLDEKRAVELINLPPRDTLIGLRDRALISLMLEAGLERREAAALKVDQFQMRDNRRCLVDIKGKSRRLRTVGLHATTARRIQAWIDASGIKSGPLLRTVNKAEGIGAKAMSAAGVYKRIRDYAAKLGVEIRPHDLRRTFATLARRSEKPATLEQIQAALGHASVRTTERYLSTATDLKDSAADHLAHLNAPKETESKD